MKKKYSYLLAMVMVAMFSFVSCSSDDDDNDDDAISNGFELYLDNVKQDVSTSSNVEYNSSNVVD